MGFKIDFWLVTILSILSTGKLRLFSNMAILSSRTWKSGGILMRILSTEFLLKTVPIGQSQFPLRTYRIPLANALTAFFFPERNRSILQICLARNPPRKFPLDLVTNIVNKFFVNFWLKFCRFCRKEGVRFYVTKDLVFVGYISKLNS